MSKPPTLLLFEDESPHNGIYEGNLAYGRVNHLDPTSRSDISAMRDKNGRPRNKPRFCLQPIKKRAKDVWSKTPSAKNKLKRSKSRVGPPNSTFQTLVLHFFKYYNHHNKLKSNIRVRIGNSIYVVNENDNRKLRRLLH
jgi:hypothetical protein